MFSFIYYFVLIILIYRINKIKNKPLNEFLKMESFNNEDKLFLNRLVYIVFKKNGPQADFETFYKKCKSLQVKSY